MVNPPGLENTLEPACKQARERNDQLQPWEFLNKSETILKAETFSQNLLSHFEPSSSIFSKPLWERDRSEERETCSMQRVSPSNQDLFLSRPTSYRTFRYPDYLVGIRVSGE
jgi:hypothetical protein